MAGIGDPSHSNSNMRVGLPVAPRRRFIYVFKCPNTANAPKGVTPMVIDTSGLFFRREINQASYITGISPPEVYIILKSENFVDLFGTSLALQCTA